MDHTFNFIYNNRLSVYLRKVKFGYYIDISIDYRYLLNMKYLITESKLKRVVYNYLKDYENLIEFDGDFFDWDNGQNVEAIEFGKVEWDPIFTYYKIPSNTKKYKDKSFLELLPALHSNNFDFLDTLKTLFGEESTDIVIDWFEDTYGYKVNTLI